MKPIAAGTCAGFEGQVERFGHGLVVYFHDDCFVKRRCTCGGINNDCDHCGDLAFFVRSTMFFENQMVRVADLGDQDAGIGDWRVGFGVSDFYIELNAANLIATANYC